MRNAVCHFVELQRELTNQSFSSFGIAEQRRNAFKGAQDFTYGRKRKQSYVKTEPFHLSRFGRIDCADDTDHQIWPLSSDHFKTGAHEIADFGQIFRFGRVIAMIGNADQAIAKTEREDCLSEAWSKGDDAPRKTYGCGIAGRRECNKKTQADQAQV